MSIFSSFFPGFFAPSSFLRLSCLVQYKNEYFFSVHIFFESQREEENRVRQISFPSVRDHVDY
jgi:hypothetical protein